MNSGVGNTCVFVNRAPAVTHLAATLGPTASLDNYRRGGVAGPAEHSARIPPLSGTGKYLKYMFF